jgi:hypothetical protein
MLGGASKTISLQSPLPYRSRDRTLHYPNDHASCREGGLVYLDDELMAWGKEGRERGGEPFRRPPGGSHEQLPDMAFPSNLNLLHPPLPPLPSPRKPLSHTPSSHCAPSPCLQPPEKPFFVPRAKLNGVSVSCVEYFVASLRTYASVRYAEGLNSLSVLEGGVSVWMKGGGRGGDVPKFDEGAYAVRTFVFLLHPSLQNQTNTETRQLQS